ncbi:phasin family protein [Billgrantia desiderata]|uniref:Phasin family protein n=1 Tax=Billgrantia desiderata TaxID=52021 RepID=A0AAW4YSB2_9GAMM|nr:phasin family protein [Halomonas desiderata]MCE8010897.1 phasin family protein [Halomonas desiderata]MCE8027567.1 phasin family protein [Halomonas desiderata]MCE8041186.1 phasin family protein [Halomonas desiderata]MCE8045761.1 phasin family protein [Halomonas desiderata]MCE8051164.1 phasin family protein [Halomonas desiderata]
MMKSFSFDTKPFEAMLLGPARAYAALSIDYSEKLVGAQLEAVKAYTDTSLAQARKLLEVRDADGLRSYLEDQQQFAKNVTERLKGDAEKAVSLHQDFFQQSQKLAESSLQEVQKASSSQTAKA